MRTESYLYWLPISVVELVEILHRMHLFINPRPLTFVFDGTKPVLIDFHGLSGMFRCRDMVCGEGCRINATAVTMRNCKLESLKVVGPSSMGSYGIHSFKSPRSLLPRCRRHSSEMQLHSRRSLVPKGQAIRGFREARDSWSKETWPKLIHWPSSWAHISSYDSTWARLRQLSISITQTGKSRTTQEKDTKASSCWLLSFARTYSTLNPGIMQDGFFIVSTKVPYRSLGLYLWKDPHRWVSRLERRKVLQPSNSWSVVVSILLWLDWAIGHSKVVISNLRAS